MHRPHIFCAAWVTSSHSGRSSSRSLRPAGGRRCPAGRGLKIGLDAVARAGDQAQPDRVCHRVFCPVGHAAASGKMLRSGVHVRSSEPLCPSRISGRPRALKFEHARHVFHEDDRDLLARHRSVRLKRRAGRSGDHAGLIRPADRVLIPVLCEVGKRRRAAHLGWLHDLRARRGQLRPDLRCRTSADASRVVPSSAQLCDTSEHFRHVHDCCSLCRTSADASRTY